MATCEQDLRLLEWAKIDAEMFDSPENMFKRCYFRSFRIWDASFTPGENPFVMVYTLEKGLTRLQQSEVAAYLRKIPATPSMITNNSDHVLKEPTEEEIRSPPRFQNDPDVLAALATFGENFDQDGFADLIFKMSKHYEISEESPNKRTRVEPE